METNVHMDFRVVHIKNLCIYTHMGPKPSRKAIKIIIFQSSLDSKQLSWDW